MQSRKRQPRILVAGINYAPECIGTGKYTSEFCEWLAARGHDVRVVTAPPYYPEWKVASEHRTRWFRRERRNGVDVIRCPTWVPAKPRGITRMLHLASFGLSSIAALIASLPWRPDLVINIAPTLASAPGAWAIARIGGAKCWLHIQDFEVDAAMDMGIVDAGPLRRMVLAVERVLLRRFDVVSTISPKMIERLTDKGVALERRASFPNWADIERIRPLTAPSAYRAELDIPERAIVALYSGNMGLKQGLELLGKTARRLADEPHLYFVFGGEGPARAELEAACAGLPNVRFLGLQPTERMQDWLGLADIHLLPQRADVADLVMPSKLTGMLASGRVVLATALPGTGVAHAIAGCGIATPPGDANAFTGALRELLSDSDLRRDLGDAARARAEHDLARDAILARIDARIRALLLDTIPDKATPA
ncbi:Glycosyl transferase [Lysobacter dokdonensis DS-58]|uniref:Glycosyl transferase n=1 Tax=Lysobacter dokdonensis DS-58 TaxID=1300345 RepID=A0A0A2WPN9_9GAMM|nr:glycosyltransferase WbuB [Lysobacter dokdonensis]KGQ20245.1 Glycosyl transferase [Lysobacter dokdonensis DS-58]